MTPPCEHCAPFDGNWQETPSGLKRCECARGKELAAADIRNRNATQAAAAKAAEKAGKDKKARTVKAAARRHKDRELAARYRDMPLIDGGYR